MRGKDIQKKPHGKHQNHGKRDDTEFAQCKLAKIIGQAGNGKAIRIYVVDTLEHVHSDERCDEGRHFAVDDERAIDDADDDGHEQDEQKCNAHRQIILHAETREENGDHADDRRNRHIHFADQNNKEFAHGNDRNKRGLTQNIHDVGRRAELRLQAAKRKQHDKQKQDHPIAQKRLEASGVFLGF